MTEPTPNEKERNDADLERLVANAVADYLDRISQGETLDIAGFCRMHANLEPDLRVALETAEGIDVMLQLSEPSRLDCTQDFPERLSGHKILSEIGSGGMGRVLLAADERLGR